jgi:hypothetical protein
VAKLHARSANVLLILVSGLTVSCFAQVQENGNAVSLLNQEVRVANLPSLLAPSTHRSAALATELEIVLHDKALCCGRDSALEDVAQYATLAAPVSLKELGSKLQGRHLLSDGRPIVVNAAYVPQTSVNSSLLVSTLQNQRAALIEWKSHAYVLYGATYDEYRDPATGERDYVIHKLLLLDPRFSDQRREIEFDRATDDWGTVQGLLTLSVVRP